MLISANAARKHSAEKKAPSPSVPVSCCELLLLLLLLLCWDESKVRPSCQVRSEIIITLGWHRIGVSISICIVIVFQRFTRRVWTSTINITHSCRWGHLMVFHNMKTDEKMMRQIFYCNVKTFAIEPSIGGQVAQYKTQK